MGVLDRRDPVADGGADGLLQRPRARLDRDHLGAQQPHPLDVRRLAADVLAAHVDGAVEAEEGAGRGRGDAVLPGAGLGDHPGLAHPPGQQRLADRVVDLVGARVGEVLALQVDAAADPLREALGEIERRRSTDEVAQQHRELGLEALVLTRLGPGGAELVERRDQGLGDEPAAVGAEALLDCGAHGVVTREGSSTPAASRNASTLAWSLRPGSASTPLTTSTAIGLDQVDRAGDVLGGQPARQDHRHLRAPLRHQVPVEALARAAVDPVPVGVEEMEVRAEGLGRLDVGGAGRRASP